MNVLTRLRCRCVDTDETKTADGVALEVGKLPSLSIAWWKFRRMVSDPERLYVIEPRELLKPTTVSGLLFEGGRLELFIGRDVAGPGDICLPSPEKEISRKHARVFAQGPAQVRIQALAAKNGTEVTSTRGPFPYLQTLLTGDSSILADEVMLRLARDWLGEVFSIEPRSQEGGVSQRLHVQELGVALSAWNKPVELKFVQALCAAPWFQNGSLLQRTLSDAMRRCRDSSSSALLLQHVRPPPDCEIPRFESEDRRVWFIHFRGQRFGPLRLRGMWFLAEAVREPLRRWDVLELDNAYYRDGAAVHTGNAGDQIDMRAARELRDHLDEVDREIERAISDSDAGRVEKLRRERQDLEDHLHAIGLGGRPRRAGDDRERARSRVKHLVDRALRAIAECDAELGERLIASIETGHEICFDLEEFAAQ